MQSKAKDVTAYIKEAPVERQEALHRLRDLCREILLDFEETMDYGGPSYKRNGEGEVGFASQKHFIGLYILRTDVMAAQRPVKRERDQRGEGRHPLFQTRADRF